VPCVTPTLSEKPTLAWSSAVKVSSALHDAVSGTTTITRRWC
jgi:hypothetical protein